MPQLRLLREQRDLTFGIAVAVPANPGKRPALTVACGDGTGRVSSEGVFRLPSGDIADLGEVLKVAWLEWWYGEPTAVPGKVEAALRDLGLMGAHVRIL